MTSRVFRLCSTSLEIITVNNAKVLAYDIIAVLVFAVLARMAHGGLGLVAILDTFWPFAIGALGGWLLTRSKDQFALGSGAIVWLCTAIVGLAIWGLRHQAFPHWSFILVATIMSGLLLMGWRLIARAVTKKSAVA